MTYVYGHGDAVPIVVIEQGHPNGMDLVMGEPPIGARMIGAVAAGCRAAEGEAANSDVRIVCVAYDPETGNINLASSHDKESTSNALMIAVRKFAGMEMRRPWGAKEAAAARKARKEADRG